MRLLLFFGFGGLLGLLSFTDVSALSVLRKVQLRNEEIRNEYVARARLLEQLRSDIYLLGTYVRDLLMDDDMGRAAIHRAEFGRTRQSIESAIEKYRSIRQSSEAAAFNSLAAGTREYIDALKPALAWDSDERRVKGRPFMLGEVLRRRMTMMQVADDVSKVNERQLAEGGAQVRNMFARSRQSLSVLFVLTIALGIAVAGFSAQRMLSLQKQARQRYREAELSRTEAHDLSARLVDAQEDERRKISRELHDEVGQSLSALLVGLGNLSSSLPPQLWPETQEEIKILRTLAEKNVAAVRNMSLLLRPSMLDDLGLVAALQWQAREIARSTGMRVSVAADELPENLAEELKIFIYRIVQETLNNCQKHAQAKRARIQVQKMPGKLLLTVQDDGCGFQVAERGLGLLGIEERVNRLKGQLQIDSGTGRGTLISVEFPLLLNDDESASA